MFGIRNSISKKLTVVTLLAGGAAVVCASAGFFFYAMRTSRQEMLDRLSVQAQIVGYNCVTPLIFDDPASAKKTLASLQVSPHILYAGVYAASGQFFAGYWSDSGGAKAPLPLIAASQIRNRWPNDEEFAVVQPIVFDGKPVGTVYIRSDVRELNGIAKGYLIVLVIVLMACLGGAILVARLSHKAISEPIANLAETARTVTSSKDFSLRAKRGGHGDEVSVLVDSFNEMLTEIQERDTELQERETQFRTLADSVPQLAWMAHANGDIFWYNERWYEYTGTSPGEAKGWGWESVHDPAVLPEVLKRWRAAIERGERLEMVFPLRGRDGTYREFLTLVVPVRDGEGNVARWFGTNTDITEQRRAQEALRKSEKLAAAGRLAASIAHEINNPLEALGNLLYLIKKQPGRAAWYLGMAEEELERISEITRHTLGFYRDAATPAPASLSEIAGGVLALYERKLRFKNIRVEERLSDDTEIRCYPGEIRQIMANLVANAIEAVSSGGRIRVSVHRAREWTNGGRNGVRVTVGDDGPGIGREHLRQIFEPFYTTKKDTGTGLGLWLTQNLVSKHQGTIRVRSRAGTERSGTVFSIFLPSAMGEGQNEASEGGDKAEERIDVPKQ